MNTSTGALSFATGDIAKGNTISVDYVADKKVDTLPVKDATTSLQLTKGSLSSNGAVIGAEIAGLAIKVTTGASTTQYKVERTSDASWTILDGASSKRND